MYCRVTVGLSLLQYFLVAKQTMSDVLYNSSLLLTLTIVDLILASLTVFGNILLLMTIIFDSLRCLRTPTTHLIANLAVSDLFMGLFIGYGRALVGYFMYADKTEPYWIDIVVNVGGGATLINGIWTVIAMSFDRYLAVTSPLLYSERVTGRRVLTYILTSWPLAMTMTAFYPLAGQTWPVFLLVFSHTHFTIPVFVLLAVYSRIFCSLSQRRHELSRFTTSVSTMTLRHALERERKIALTSFAILILFCASFLPIYIKIHLLNFCRCLGTMGYRKFDLISHTFLYFSSFVDPFVYAWRVPKFRRSLQGCLRIRKRNNVRPIGVKAAEEGKNN